MKYFMLSILIFCQYANAMIDKSIDIKNSPKSKQSWMQLKYHNITKQAYDYSCGASSVSTVLSHFYQTPVSESELLSKMRLENMMASFLDMSKVVNEYGFQGVGIATDYDNLKKLTIPAIVHLNYKRNDHFSVVRAIDDDFIYLSDSSFGNRKLSKKQFLNLWQVHNDGQYKGRVLLIIPNNKQLPTNIEFARIVPNKLSAVDIIKPTLF